jgi:prolyl 4-hydroxylase
MFFRLVAVVGVLSACVVTSAAAKTVAVPFYAEEACGDLRPFCADRIDTCQSNAKYMHPHCPQTCGVCHQQTRWVTDSDAPWGVTGLEDVVNVVGSELGVPQLVDPLGTGEWSAGILQRVQDSRDYYEDVVMVEKRYERVRKICQNKQEHCSFFAAQGECEANEDWMFAECAPACQACHELHIEAKCPLDPNSKHAWYPGDLDRMFERILSDPAIVARFEPKVWARPTLAPGDTDADAVDYLIDSPWVVTLENFLNASEAKVLIEWGGEIGYERSADVGEEEEDGSFGDDINDDRTSENSWCDDGCAEDPVTVDIMHRMEAITGIPANNSESLQLLRYEVGQFYKVHHDFIGYEVDRLEGPRVSTPLVLLVSGR